MAYIKIAITGASVTPNPVKTGAQYIISVEISEMTYLLSDTDETVAITDNDGTTGLIVPNE